MNGRLHGSTEVRGAPERSSQGAESNVMEDTEQSFEFESLQDRERILKYLEALVDGVRHGTITLEYGAQSMTLSPSGLIELELRGKRRGGRAKLSVRLAWREDAGRGPNLEIGAV